MNEWFIIAAILCGLSFVVNVLLITYVRQNIVRVFVISEEAVDIFTRMDSFKEHLTTVYELPTFYGDETLSGLLEHAKALSEFLSKYEGLHSFTQPDLVEELERATLELQSKYDQEETQPSEEG